MDADGFLLLLSLIVRIWRKGKCREKRSWNE